MDIIIPKTQDYHSIDVNSAETPKVSVAHKRLCERYRARIERNKELAKISKNVRPIDNIDVGMLTAFVNPINLAIQLLNPGGEVYIPAGTFTQTDDSDEITVVDNCLIRGSGYATIIKQAKTKSDQMQVLNITSKDNVTVKDISFNGDSATIFAAGYSSEHDHGISSGGSENVKIINCDFYNFNGDCVYVSSSSTNGASENILIQGCTFNNPKQQNSPVRGRNCVTLLAATYDLKRVRISGCRFKNGNPACIDIEPDVDGGDVEDVVISNCNFEHASGEQYRGIAIEPNTTGTTAKNISISNCTFNFHEYGIILNTSNKNENMDSIVISHNIFKNCGYGVHAAGATNIKLTSNHFRSCGYGIFMFANNLNIDLQGNSFGNCTKNAITFPGTSGNENEHVIINNNMIVNASYGNAGQYSAIHLANTDDSEVVGNMVLDDQVTPTAKYPLETVACDKLIYMLNYSRGLATSDSPYIGLSTNYERKFNYEGATNGLKITGDLQLSATDGSEMFRLGGKSDEGEAGARLFYYGGALFIDSKGANPIQIRQDDDDGDTARLTIGDKIIAYVDINLNGDVAAGADGLRLHVGGDDSYISSKGGNSLHIRQDDTDGSTDVATFSDANIRMFKNLQIDAALDHDGSTVGFYAKTPTTQAAHFANASGSHDVTGADSVSQTAVQASLNALGGTINSIIAVLENVGLMASA